MKKLIFITLSVGMILGIITCSDNFDHQIKQPDHNVTPKIVNNGSYLEFASQRIFDEALEELRNADADKANQWAKPFGFVSMRMIYEEALKEELSVLSKSDTINTNVSSNIGPFTKKHEHLFTFNTDNNIVGLKTFHFDVSNFLNVEGIVKIAGHIFQYNEDNVKIILKGDPNKISMLKNIQTSDTIQQIIVSPVERKIISGGDADAARYSYSHSKACVVRPTLFSSRYRIQSSINLAYYTVPIYGDYICDASCDPYMEQRSQISSTKDIESYYIPPDCQCYYEIIGYTTRQYYRSTMKVEKTNFWGDWRAYGANQAIISVDWHVNGIRQNPAIVSKYSTSSLSLTVFDGSALKNVTYGQHVSVAAISTSSFEFGIKCTDSFSD